MTNFRLPGPTPLPPAVLAAMQRPMINHRGPVMKELYRSILARLRDAHRTSGDVLVWPGSGSAGWECAIVNLLSPGDRVLSLVVGDFGERCTRVAQAFGLDVRRLDRPWGSAVTADEVGDALDREGPVKAVFVTHNETSTGVTNPLREIAAVVRAHGALSIVDAVSSVGAMPLEVDDWGLDFVLSGSQKAWMCPPGLMIAAVGPRAWDAYAASTFPRFFWDLGNAKKFAEQGMTPATPALTLLFALDAALELISTEGLEAVWARHAALAARTRAGVRRLGMTVFGDERFASSTVTTVRTPDGVATKELLRVMKDEHDIELQGGQGQIADTTFRIGHMGWVSEADIDDVLAGLAATLAGVRTAAVVR